MSGTSTVPNIEPPVGPSGDSAVAVVDDAALAGWLTALGVAHRGPFRGERIGLGQSNLTYVVTDADGRRWVVRRPPLGTLLASAHDVVREARILSAVAGTAVPVPRVLGVLEHATVPMVLMEFVEGTVIDRPDIAAALPAEQRRAAGIALPRTLSDIHALDLERIGLADLASHKPYAQRQLTRWARQWEQSKTRESPKLDRLTERLRAAIPPQHEITLVHGDFHIRNVITEPRAGTITAVLDWELCTLGDPLADLGSLLAYWPEPGERPGDSFGVCALPGFPNREELAAEYFACNGRDPGALRFWHALGLWKVAIIREGVVRRARDSAGNRAAAGVPTTAGVDALIDAATAVAAGL